MKRTSFMTDLTKKAQMTLEPTSPLIFQRILHVVGLVTFAGEAVAVPENLINGIRCEAE